MLEMLVFTSSDRGVETREIPEFGSREGERGGEIAPPSQLGGTPVVQSHAMEEDNRYVREERTCREYEKKK